MQDIKAIIFDMDGVIVDSEPLHERAFLDIFEEMGYGQTHGIDFTRYYGYSDRAVWIDFVAKHNPPQPLAELVDWKQKHFLEILLREQPIFPPIEALMMKLSGRFILGLASGSAHAVINEVLKMRNLRRFIQAAVSAQDVPRGKPAPDIFLLAAERLGVDPRHCCVIEDAAAGVEAALAAGMQVIAITNTLSRAMLSRATQVVDGYQEIERLLLNGASTA